MTTPYRICTILSAAAERRGTWIMRGETPLIHLRSEVTEEQTQAILAALIACEPPQPEPEDPNQLTLFPA